MVMHNLSGVTGFRENIRKAFCVSSDKFRGPHINLNLISVIKRPHKTFPPMEFRNPSFAKVSHAHISLGTEILLWLRFELYTSSFQPV